MIARKYGFLQSGKVYISGLARFGQNSADLLKFLVKFEQNSTNLCLTNCEMCGMLNKSGKVYFSGLFVFGFWLGEWVEWVGRGAGFGNVGGERRFCLQPMNFSS